MPADKPLDPPATPKTDEAPALKPGDVLGEIDGVPFKVGDKVGESEPASLAEWHEAFTKHRDVEVTTPAYRSSVGLPFPAQTAVVPLPSIRSVVAHRALHSLPPKALAEAKKAVAEDVAKLKLEPGSNEHARAEHAALLKLVATSDLMTKGGKDHPAVPHWEAATQTMIAEHAHPARLAKHHAELATKSAPTKSAS